MVIVKSLSSFPGLLLGSRALVCGVVWVALVGMVAQVRLSPCTRVSLLMACVLGVVWVALVGMVAQVCLCPCARVRHPAV